MTLTPDEQLINLNNRKYDEYDLELKALRVTQVDSTSSTSIYIYNFKVSDLDDSADPNYFGFLDKQGNWYILRLTSTAARYAVGSSAYTASWDARTSLDYDYYNIKF